MNIQITSTRPYAATQSTDCEMIQCLDLLANASARAILTTLGDDPLTASELAKQTDLPSSTVYRHLNELNDAGLIEETIRFNLGGKHAAQYARTAVDIVISVADGFSISVISH